MAKKRKKSKNTSSSGGSGILILVSLIVCGGFLYGYFKKEGNLEGLTKNWAETTSQKETTSENSTITPKKVERPIASSPKKDSPAEEVSESKLETVETNPDLPVYSENTDYYYSNSFDFSWPAYKSGEAIIEHEHFTLRYNEKTEQADWVAYKLTAKKLNNARFKRKDNFRADLMVSTESAHPNDYVGSGYDRGHLAPAADFTWSQEALSETFFMSNMSPQTPGFNRGIWKRLEEQTRVWAKANQELFIVTGPIIESKKQKIGKNKVVVPEKFYKVILDLHGEEVKAIAFILPNENSSKNLSYYAMSVDKAEKITGLDFFPLIPDDLEKSLESQYRFEDW